MNAKSILTVQKKTVMVSKIWRPIKSTKFFQTMIVGINKLTFFFSTMQTLQKWFYNKCTKMVTWFYNRCTKLVTWSSKCLIPLSFHHPHFYWFQIYSLCSNTNSPRQANMAYCKKNKGRLNCKKMTVNINYLPLPPQSK